MMNECCVVVAFSTPLKKRRVTLEAEYCVGSQSALKLLCPDDGCCVVTTTPSSSFVDQPFGLDSFLWLSGDHRGPVGWILVSQFLVLVTVNDRISV